MKDIQLLDEELQAPGRLSLFSLVISYFIIWLPTAVVYLLLIEIGETFDISIGVVGQLSTASSIATGFASLLIGILSVRYNNKLLFLIGLMFISLSAIGSVFAANFIILLFFISLSGLGMGMVDPMAFAIIGEQFPLKKRGFAIGCVVAGAGLADLIGPPVISILVGIGGWRFPFLGFILPIVLLGLILAIKFVPGDSVTRSVKRQEAYFEGYKTIFNNRSAIACLIGAAFTSIAMVALTVYGVSFFRERFLISLRFTALIFTGLGGFFILGNLSSSFFITRFGSKPVTVFACLFGGTISVSFTHMPLFGLSLILWLIGGGFFGMRTTAVQSITLEQEPSFRGTMMALNTTAMYLGSALGAGLGGWVLLNWNYEIVGLVLGMMGIISALIFYFLSVDPTRTKII